MTFCDSLSIGVNVFLVFLFLILGFLFSLPLKFILSEDPIEMSIGSKDKLEEKLIDYRRLKLCENFGYVSVIKSIFFICNYDGNCTDFRNESNVESRMESTLQRSLPIIDLIQVNNDNEGEFLSDNTNRGNLSANQRKSVSIAGNILGVMLVLSALAALVEVLRARLFENKHPEENGVPRHGIKKCSSVVDIGQRRNVRKETVQAQKSFEIQGMMHRSPLRLLAARPPPLLRRSSFPAQCIRTKDLPISTTTTATTTTGRLSRRSSFLIDSEEEPNNFTDFRRHSRLIRRH